MLLKNKNGKFFIDSFYSIFQSIYTGKHIALTVFAILALVCFDNAEAAGPVLSSHKTISSLAVQAATSPTPNGSCGSAIYCGVPGSSPAEEWYFSNCATDNCGTETWYVTGLPSNVTASINPATTTGTAVTTVKLNIGANAVVGNYTVTIGANCNNCGSAQASLTIIPPQPASNGVICTSSAPCKFSGSPDQQATISLNMLSPGCDSNCGTETWSASGLPTTAGTASFSPATTTTSQSTTLTVSIPANAVAGNYTFQANVACSGTTSCSPGYVTLTVNPGTSSDKNTGNICDNIGACTGNTDPINIGTGNLFEQVTDYETAGPNKLTFKRYYNSMGGSITYALALGSHWRTNYDRYLSVLSSTSVQLEREDGQLLNFTKSGTIWASDTDVDLKLTQSGSTWTLTDKNDTVETYNVLASGQGLLSTITLRGGYMQTMHYNTSNQLTSVSDMYGRALTFTYTGRLLTSMVTPENNTYKYSYGSSGIIPGVNDRLQYVYYPIDGTYYTYNYTYGTGAQAFSLFSVLDSSGGTYSSWTYDSATNRALTSQLGGGIANKYTVVYNADGSRTVTNPFGVVETYTYSTLQGVPKITKIARAATSTTAASTKNYTYDTSGYTASETDWNGNLTKYVNDTHGQPTSITQAFGTTAARTVTVGYNASYHVPATITATGLTTSFTYDTAGNLLTKTLKDTTSTTVPYSTNAQTRVWTYGWTNALPTSIKDPNLNTTSFTFDATGALTKTTNPLTQSTTIASHTAGSYPLTIVDANSVTTTLTYDANMRLSTSALTTAAGVNTTTYNYTYKSYPEAISVINFPDTGYISYGRDAAHRKNKDTNSTGGIQNYTLDALGNVTALAVQDSQYLYRQHSNTYDALGRMLTDVGGMSQTATYTYDNNGNALTVKDPLTYVTTNVYDALNRRTKVTDANTGITSFTYDAHDRPLTVTDANNHVTSYVYDGFGDVIQTTSPDTGTTVYHYDANGNLIQSTDALNVVTNHTYDAINRIKTTTYPASSTENITYTYDETGHGKGIGRLTTVVDAAGTLSRSYEEHGSVSSEKRTRSAIVMTTAYTYDKNGRLASINYPSGGKLNYNYNTDGSLYSFPFTNAGTTWNGYLSHQPFGPVTSIVAYDYPTQSFFYDLDDRMTSNLVQDTSQLWMGFAYTYDANDNMKTITDYYSSTNNQTLGYDVINRLTSATGGYGSYVYTLDKVGNRLTSKLGTVTTNYGINAANNRLTAVGAQAVTTNANGSITAVSPAMPSGVNSLTYNNAGRLSAVKSSTATLASYLYDAFGHRTVKTTGSTGALFIYGPGGELLEETDATGHPIVDYIYAEGRLADVWNIPLQQMVTTYTDHLGTPRVANDKYGLTAWKANYEPFGATSNIVTSNSYTGPVVENLRLPGQYADAESGFSQNGFRDYVPGWGRYLQSDPIGLGGGMNTYAYANGNPMKWTDKKGLWVDCTADNPSGADHWWETMRVNDNGITEAEAAINLIAMLFPQILAVEPLMPQDTTQSPVQDVNSPFNEDGTLNQSAIDNSKQIIEPNKIKNPDVPDGFGKNTTSNYPNPSGGSYQVHFYKNEQTGEVYYGRDYKSIPSKK